MQSPPPPLAALLDPLLTSPRAPLRAASAGFERDFAQARAAAEPAEAPLDRAIVAGFFSPNLSVAFAVGYLAAQDSLFGRSPALRALAVSERQGQRPRDLQTTLRADAAGFRLDGHKSFVTLGDRAETLLIVANSGASADGRPQLRVVRVPASQAGVRVQPGPQLPVVPELQHAQVQLQGVAVAAEQLLPGDGYEQYVKPFRTLEDLHVLAALLGHLLRLARAYALPPELSADLCSSCATLRALAGEPPAALSTHVTLAGALRTLDEQLKRHETAWQALPEPLRAATLRDLAVRQIARAAREKRWANAAAALSADPDA